MIEDTMQHSGRTDSHCKSKMSLERRYEVKEEVDTEDVGFTNGGLLSAQNR